MIRLITLIGCFSLCGCATIGNVTASICEREYETRAALELALIQSYDIEDNAKRDIAIAGIRASLAALDACESF